jgi:N-alpha-acetyltransferase 15/16, NatA auxiliary subunit
MRDAANLQAQLRAYDTLVDTRAALLRLRPNLRQNWVALAAAHHLNGAPAEAIKVLENYESLVKVCASVTTRNIFE